MRTTIEVAGVEIKQGEARETHKPYIKYIITSMDGIRYSTFDKPSKLNQVVAGAKLTLDYSETDKPKQMNILTIIKVEPPAQKITVKPKEELALAPLPIPLTDEQIGDMLHYAEVEAMKKLGFTNSKDAYEDIRFIDLLKIIFNAKRQQQEQQYGVAMSKRVQTTKEANMAKSGIR
jgi:hypothetical protein